MNVSDLVEFSNVLGLENVQADEQRGWVRASCPFAPWTHKRGTDSNPSFGMSTGDPAQGGGPGYHCLACGQSGSLFDLVFALQFYKGKHLAKASRFLHGFPEVFGGGEQSRANTGKRIKTQEYLDVFTRRYPTNVPVPEDILAKYPLLYPEREGHPDIYHYLEDVRGISPAISQAYGLRGFVSNGGDSGIVFPLVSLAGGNKTVVDLWVRFVNSKKFLRLTPEMSGSRAQYHAPHLWFGQQFRDNARQKPLMLVEGAFDVLRLKSLGLVLPTWASLGPPSARQIEQLKGYTLYMAFDADEAGSKFSQTVEDAREAGQRVYRLDWGIVGVKDGGDVKDSQQIQQVLRHLIAIEPRHRKVVDFSKKF